MSSVVEPSRGPAADVAADGETPPSLSVVVPTYRRPDRLQGCLRALAAQRRPPNEIVVVARRDDEASWEVVDRSADLVRGVTVQEPGYLAALRAGAAATSGEVIAFTDDDAEPAQDWTDRLLAHFRDPAVGAVGGRDLIPGSELPPARTVGIITRWGKLIGNHSRGVGGPRHVNVLKGVNMSYRRDALALPRAYRDSKTQHHVEVAMGLWAQARGWKIVYDPEIVVVHHESPRPDGTARRAAERQFAAQTPYNLVAGIIAARPDLVRRRALYGTLIGDRGAPGVGRAVLSLAQRRPGEARVVVASIAAQLAALRDGRAGRGLVMDPVESLRADQGAD